MENFDQYEGPSEDNLKDLEELERKKQIKRENRLNEIVEKNSEILQSIFPEKADNFEITYDEIKERRDSIFGGMVQISSSQLPAYGIFLISKVNPEKKYQIMHWFRSDLDAKKANFDTMMNQSFADKIRKGIEELERG